MKKNVVFRKPFERLSNVDDAFLMEVIVVLSLAGEGDGVGSPMRTITEYFSKKGELLARHDPWLDGELEKGIWSNDSLSETKQPTDKGKL